MWALAASRDLSLARLMLSNVWSRLEQHAAALEDVTYAKEVRWGTYRNESSLPPAAIVTGQKFQSDPMGEPLRGERVSFVVAYAGPGSSLREQCRDALRMLGDATTVHAGGRYYRERATAKAVDRAVGLSGAPVVQWCADDASGSRVSGRRGNGWWKPPMPQR